MPAVSPKSPSASKLSTIRGSPRYSFGSRPNERHVEERPGPGAYSGPPSGIKFRASPSHGFGSSGRPLHRAAGPPGPGRYEHPATTEDRSKGAGIGLADRDGYLGRKQTPGPGTYGDGGRFSKQIGSAAPAFSAGIRREDPQAPEAPGPGTYDCEAEVATHATGARPRSPTWGFGSSERPRRILLGSPGPAYGKEGGGGGPAFSIGERFEGIRSGNSPGPGAYDSHITMFSY